MIARCLLVAAVVCGLALGAARGAPVEGADPPAAGTMPDPRPTEPAEVAAEANAATERLRRAYFGPLHDAGAGALFDATLRMLEVERALPRRVVLPEARADSEGAGADKPTAAEEPAAARPPGPDLAGTPGWLKAAESAVVPDDEAGYAFFRAGDYEQAAWYYTRAHKADPDDAHVLTMLLLSERNAGHAGRVPELMAALAKRDHSPDWAEWLSGMMALAQAPVEAAE